MKTKKIYYTATQKDIRQFGMNSNNATLKLWYRTANEGDSLYKSIVAGATEFVYSENLEDLRIESEKYSNNTKIEMVNALDLPITGNRDTLEDVYVTNVLLDKHQECIAKYIISDFEHSRPCYWASVCVSRRGAIIGILSIGRELNHLSDADLRRYNDQARLNLGIKSIINNIDDKRFILQEACDNSGEEVKTLGDYALLESKRNPLFFDWLFDNNRKAFFLGELSTNGKEAWEDFLHQLHQIKKIK